MRINNRAINKKIVFTTVLFFCVVLFCGIKLIQKNKEYHFADIAVSNVQETGADPVEFMIYDNIALPAGVYNVSLEYTTAQNMNYHVTMKDTSVFTNGLQTNGEVLYDGLNKTSFHMWLYEDTENMQLWLSGNGAGVVTIGALYIYETNKLWTMLISVAVLLYSFSLLVIWYINYRKDDSEVIKQKTVVCALFFIVLLSSIPYLLGVSIGGADGTYHLQRIEGVKDGLLSGQFPVRLEPEWVHGHGYANAIFYCNALLLFPAILRLLGFTVTASYSAYCIMLNIATTMISYYCFSRIYKSKYIGVLCSGLYTLSIFRIYKLVITGATGEGSAVTFMPLVLYGLYRVFTEETDSKRYKTAWFPISLGYAGLIQTHVLSCEITALLTIIICIICVKKVFTKPIFCELAKGAMGALLLSVWYLIPFLDYYMTQDLHIKHVSGRTIQERGLYPAQLFFHFWKSGDNAMIGENGMMHSHAMGVGFILAIALVVFAGMWFMGIYKNVKQPQILLGKVSCILGGMLMLMSLKVFPWDKIQQMSSLSATLVSSLQFPNRFLGWGTVFMVATIGCLLCYFDYQKAKTALQTGVAVIIIGFLTSNMYLIDYINIGEEQFPIYNEEGMGFGYISGEEYKIEGTNPGELYYNSPAAEEGIIIKEYQKHYLEIDMQIENTLDKEGAIEVPLTNYKGYKAYSLETNELLPIQMGTNGVISVCVPSGFSGNMKIAFVSPLHWRIAEVITYLAWLYVLVYTCKMYGIKIRKGKKDVEEVCAGI